LTGAALPIAQPARRPQNMRRADPKSKNENFGAALPYEKIELFPAPAFDFGAAGRRFLIKS